MTRPLSVVPAAAATPPPSDPDVEDDLLTPQDVADKLKVKVDTIYEWTRTRKNGQEREPLIPHVKVGSKTRFERAAIDAFIKSRRKGYSKLAPPAGE